MREHERLTSYLSTRPELKKELAEAIALYGAHPNSSVRSARACAELLLDEIARTREASERGRQETLQQFIDRLAEDGHVPARQAAVFHWIRQKANPTSHGRGKASKTDATLLIAMLESLAVWFCEDEPHAYIRDMSPIPSAAELSRVSGLPPPDTKVVSAIAAHRSATSIGAERSQISEVHKGSASSDGSVRKGEAQKSSRAPKTLSLKKVETSTVKQSFSHGRTKAVVVEKKRPSSTR